MRSLLFITHILDSVSTILSGLTIPGVGGVMWIAPQQGLHLYSALGGYVTKRRGQRTKR